IYRGSPARVDAHAQRGTTLAYEIDLSPRRGCPIQPLDTSGRMVEHTTLEGTSVIRYAVVLVVGYVLGTRAGRRRYEQIVGTYKAVTGNPATKTMIDAGRRKIANRVSPDPGMVTLTQVDDRTLVLQPETPRV